MTTDTRQPAEPDPHATRPPRPASAGSRRWTERDAPGARLERASSIVLRTVHLVAVAWLGGAVLGAPVSARAAAIAVVLSGLGLFALELRARRVGAFELAGVVVWAKIALAAVAALWPAGAAPVFWALLVASSLSSHAPKPVRHAALRRRAAAADRT